MPDRVGVMTAREWIAGDESAREMLMRALTARPALHLPPLHRLPLRPGNVVEIVGPSPSAKSEILIQVFFFFFSSFIFWLRCSCLVISIMAIIVCDCGVFFLMYFGVFGISCKTENMASTVAQSTFTIFSFCFFLLLLYCRLQLVVFCPKSGMVCILVD